MIIPNAINDKIWIIYFGVLDGYSQVQFLVPLYTLHNYGFEGLGIKQSLILMLRIGSRISIVSNNRASS